MNELEIARWQLRHRIGTLYGQLRRWLLISRQSSPSPQFRIHNSQIRSFARLLLGVARDIAAAAKEEDASLRSLRALSQDVLGLFRVWEYLRTKLAQRLDADLAEALQVADAFAWLCFEPAARAAYKQPPLVFLNGGVSPYMMPRHSAFQAEFVTGDTRETRLLKVLTAELPFPVIGLPWYQVSAIWDLPVIAHEVGHTVEADLKLDVAAVVGGAVADQERRKDWVRWSGEVFADYYGCIAAGPAFASTLASFLSGMGRSAMAEEYPPRDLRFALNMAFLPDVPEENMKALKQRWGAEFPVAREWEAHVQRDCPAVAAALRKLDVGLQPLMVRQYAAAAKLGGQILQQDRPRGTYIGREIVIAMRQVYDELMMRGNPAAVLAASHQLRELFMANASTDTRKEVSVADPAEAARAGAQRMEAWKKLLRER